MIKEERFLPQLLMKPIFKKIVRPFVQLALTTIELYECIDRQLFVEDDSWQMKVMYYGILFVMILLGMWAITLF